MINVSLNNLKNKSNHNYKILNIDGNVLYVSGKKKLQTMQNDKIAIYLKCGKLLIVIGENLTLQEYDKSGAMIKGNIISVEVKENE